MEVVTRPAKQDEVWLVALDPTQGSEMKKSRPCVIVSPDEMNENLRTVLIAPMTTVTRPYPTRVSIRFQGKHGQVALDQLRAVERQRLIRRLGNVNAATAGDISETLLEMFQRV